MELDTAITITTLDKNHSLVLDVTDYDERSFKEAVTEFLMNEDTNFNDESSEPQFIISSWSEELEAMQLISAKGINNDIWELGGMSYDEARMVYAWYRLQRNNGVDIIDNMRQAQDSYVGYFENDDEAVEYMKDELGDADESESLNGLSDPNTVKKFFLNQLENYEHYYFRA